jgi:predicted nucleotidyltransferase component of viral defense system
MLFRETIANSTWDLLLQISNLKALNDFSLAGGTSLSLQIGHRISYDLDFFMQGEMPNEIILEALEKLGKVEIISQTTRILVLLIDNVKVDFIRHPYTSIEESIFEDNIRLVGLKDIGAMKLHAIAGRGRKRDFVDLYFLLNHFSLMELCSFYSKRFFDGNELMVIRSLSFFKDADLDPDITYIKKSIDWEEIKQGITRSIKSI